MAFSASQNRQDVCILDKLLMCIPTYLSVLHPAVAPCCVPQTGAAHVHEAGASSAAAAVQLSRLHDTKAAGEAT